MRRYVLPWPPSINTYWRRRGPRYFISNKGQKFTSAVGEIVGGRPALQGRIGVSILLNPPDHRTRDIDNLIKPLLDALQKAGCFVDDSQVDVLVVVRGTVGKDYAPNSRGSCEVSVCHAARLWKPQSIKQLACDGKIRD